MGGLVSRARVRERSPKEKSRLAAGLSFSLIALADFVRTSGPSGLGRLGDSDPAAAGRASDRRPAGRASDPGSDSAGPDSGSDWTFGISLFALLGMQREYNGEGPGLVSEKTSVPARSLRGADLSRVWLWNRQNYPCTALSSRAPRCCRSGFPLLKNDLRRGVPAAGAIAASCSRYGSAWIISPSN